MIIPRVSRLPLLPNGAVALPAPDRSGTERLIVKTILAADMVDDDAGAASGGEEMPPAVSAPIIVDAMGLAAVSVTHRTAARLRSTQVRSAMRAYARTEVASACRACARHVDARRSTRRFCSNACRQRAYRAGRRPMLAPVAHQRRIRDVEAARDPRPAMATFEGSTVDQIPFAEAKVIIPRYEWVGTMPTVTRACYGLKTPSGELAGVAVFAAGPAPESGNLCGREHRDLAICLARGSCVHRAPPNAASFLISRACKLAHAEFGWKILRLRRLAGGRIWRGLPSGELALSRRWNRAQQGS